MLTMWLHLIQPVARLLGRLTNGLHVARIHLPRRVVIPTRRTLELWRERWQQPEDKIRRLAQGLREEGAVVVSGGDYDRWDLFARGGMLGGARVRMAVEEHGAGKQLFRFRLWPVFSPGGVMTILLGAAISLAALLDEADTASWILCILTVSLALRLLHEGTLALAAICKVLSGPFDESNNQDPQEPPR
jgi:hypothetical protein